MREKTGAKKRHKTKRLKAARGDTMKKIPSKLTKKVQSTKPTTTTKKPKPEPKPMAKSAKPAKAEKKPPARARDELILIPDPDQPQFIFTGIDPDDGYYVVLFGEEKQRTFVATEKEKDREEIIAALKSIIKAVKKSA